MQEHRIGLIWSDTGKELLTQSKNMSLQTINACEMGPHIYADSNLALLPRMLAVLITWIELRENNQEHIYEA